MLNVFHVCATIMRAHFPIPKPRRGGTSLESVVSFLHFDRWSSGDDSGANTFLTMPYFPFLSSCAGYGNHMSFSKLVESHPDCTLVR